MVNLNNLNSTLTEDQLKIVNDYNIATIGARPLSLDEQEYANQINNTVNGRGSFPLLDTEAWKNFNDIQAELLAREEQESMINEDIINIAKGFTSHDDVVRRAAELSSLREYLISAGAVSAARQLGAEAMVDNPDLTAEGLQQVRDMEYYNAKDAILENHIKMADTAVTDTPTLKKIWGYLTNFFTIPGWVDAYSKQDALKALDRGDAEWFDRADNLDRFYDLIATAHQDPRMTPKTFDAFLTYVEGKLKSAGINNVHISSMYEYLKEHDKGAQTFYQAVDYATVAGGFVGGAIKGVKAASVALKAIPGVKTATKVLATTGEGIKGATLGAADAVIPLGSKIVGYPLEGAEYVLKGRINGLDRMGKLLAAGNKRKASQLALEIMEKLPEQTSAAEKKMLFERIFPQALKHDIYAASDNIAYESEILSSKAQRAYLMKTIAAAQSTMHLSELQGELWAPIATKISKALQSTGRLEEIIAEGADFEDIIKVVEPLLTTEGNLTARVKLNLLPKYDKGLKSKRKIAYDIGGEKMFSATDKAFDTAKTQASIIKKDMEALGYDANVVPYLDSSGRYKIMADVKTNKGWTTLLREAQDLPVGEKSIKTRGFLSSLFTYSSNPTDIQELNILRALSTGPIKSSSDALMKAYKALSTDDKNLLETLVQMSIRYQAFYTPEHLLARGASEALTDTYTKWRTFNDLDYFVRNRATRDMLVSMGIKDLKYNGLGIGRGAVRRPKDKSEMQAKIRGNDDQPGRKYVVVNSTDLGKIQKSGDITNHEIEAWFDAGYVLVETLHAPDEFMDAKNIWYVLDGKSLVENDLPEFVVSYVAGGRRFFTRTGGFVKQIRMEKNSAGRNIITGVNTYGVDDDVVGLQRRVAAMEQVRLAYARNNTAEVNELIAKMPWMHKRFTDSETFAKWAEGVGMDIHNADNALEVVKDGKPLNSYSKLVQGGYDDILGPESMFNMLHRSSFQALTNEAKIAKLRRTGKELLTWDLDTAMPVDFEHQLRLMVNDMVYQGIMPYFTDFYAERFYQDFKSVINHAGEMTSKQALLLGDIAEAESGPTAKLAQSALAAKNNYMAIKGVPTDLDKAIAKNFNNVVESIAGFVEKKLPKLFTEDVAHGIRVNWKKLMDADPLNYARAATSQWYLALGNVSQLWKQWASDFAVWALDPKAAAQASKYHLPFTQALYKSDGNLFKAIDQLAKRFGDKPAEVRQTFKNLIRMGAFEHGVGGGFIEKGQSMKNLFNKWSYFFFNNGEMLNRTKAYMASLYHFGYTKADLTEVQLAQAVDYAQRLFLNMDSTGLSRIQTTTFGKTFLQYLGYRMRWLETVLFDKELSGWARFRLGLANALIVGGEGMLGAKTFNKLSNIFSDDSDDANNLDPSLAHELKMLTSQGLINYAVSNTDLGINFGNVFNLDYGDLANEMLGSGGYSIPSVTFINKGLQALGDAATAIDGLIFRDWTSEDFGSWLSIMARQGDLPSSISKPYLAWLAEETGKNFNSHIQLTEENNSALHNVLVGLGFPSSSGIDLYRAKLQKQSYKERINEWKDQVKVLYNQLADHETAGLRKTFELIMRDPSLNQKAKSQALQEIIREGVWDKNATLLQRVVKEQLENNGFGGADEAIKAIQEWNIEGE